jgi:pimeloyl-ACP methyl ester carboxylesterase
METGRRSVLLGSLAAAALAEMAQAMPDPARFKGKPPPPLRGEIKKAYVDSTWGQMHYRYVRPEHGGRRTPVVFFHPNPFSGLYFNYTLEELGRDRVAIAFDTPGYGESARPPEPQTMEALAQSFALALEKMGYGRGRGQVDVSGFHTGAYVASELAASRPDLVRRVVLSGVPFWEGELRETKRRLLLVDEPLTDDGAFIRKEWESWAVHRNKLLPIERGLELFTQAVIPGQHIWWAYYAVVNYNARPRFAQIRQPVLLVIPGGGALDPTTRAVYPLLKKGRMLVAPDLPHQIFDLAVDFVGATYRDFLDGPA